MEAGVTPADMPAARICRLLAAWCVGLMDSGGGIGKIQKWEKGRGEIGFNDLPLSIPFLGLRTTG
jgi:hypothetical protein